MDEELIILVMIIAIAVLFWRVRELTRKTDELGERLALLRQGQELSTGAFAGHSAENPVDASLWGNRQPSHQRTPTSIDELPVDDLPADDLPVDSAATTASDRPKPLVTEPEDTLTGPVVNEPATINRQADDDLDDLDGRKDLDALGPDLIIPPPKPVPAAAMSTTERAKGDAFGGDWSDRLGEWLREHWFYAISAVCLGLAGIFLIHYGVERGLLTPAARVGFAVILGFALIGAGEFIRRRVGDGAKSHTAYLPSTLSGAGVIVEFTAILGARYLYEMLGADTAFLLLVALSVTTVLLGWLYGPVLTAIGIVGATVTPFIVGGSSDNPAFFFYYFALIALVGLAIDTVKQWLWPSVLGLVMTYGAAVLLFLAGADAPHFLAFASLVAIGALTIPHRQLSPAHDGPMLVESIASLAPLQLKPPVVIAVAGVLAGLGAIGLVALLDPGLTELMAALILLVVFQLALAFWARSAPALTDLNIVPPVLYLAILAHQAVSEGSLFAQYQALISPTAFTGPEMFVCGLVGVGVLGSALALVRALQPSPYGLYWAYGLALYAPAVMMVLEALWQPTQALGEVGWGSIALGVAALMTGAAERLARVDGPDRRRVALTALSVFGLLCFGLTILLSDVALTLSLALTIPLAVLADRRFTLPLLSIFVQIGVIVVSLRLVFIPGLDWAVTAPLQDVLLAYGGCIAAMAFAWRQLSRRDRAAPKTVTESVLLSLPAIFTIVMLFRGLDGAIDSHAGQGLFASTFIITAMVQFYRLPVSEGWLYKLRYGFAMVFSIAAGFTLFAAVVAFNPVFEDREIVTGPLI
ncbi:MAG: DUF2339 domain-containing protein, partial [Pseudomonadota bacterium]